MKIAVGRFVHELHSCLIHGFLPHLDEMSLIQILRFVHSRGWKSPHLQSSPVHRRQRRGARARHPGNGKCEKKAHMSLSAWVNSLSSPDCPLLFAARLVTARFSTSAATTPATGERKQESVPLFLQIINLPRSLRARPPKAELVPFFCGAFSLVAQHYRYYYALLFFHLLKRHLISYLGKREKLYTKWNSESRAVIYYTVCTNNSRAPRSPLGHCLWKSI